MYRAGWVGLLATAFSLIVGCDTKQPANKARLTTSSSAITASWQATNPLYDSRMYHTATALPSGQVLVVGGWSSSTYLASATLYNAAAGTWTYTGALATPRQAHTATLLQSGQVLVVGGENFNGATGTAELYTPAAGTWSSAGSTSRPRAYSTATALQSGQVLITGGSNWGGSWSTVDVYDPTTGLWSTGALMNEARANHTATLLPSGKVLVVGGQAGGASQTAELYDPATGAWSYTGSMATARYDHTATLLATGQVLVTGGRNSGGPVAAAELYDPTSGTWSSTGSMTTARYLHAATLVAGKVLVSGGWTSSALSTTELYDPLAGTWSPTLSLIQARGIHTATVLPTTGKVLVTAGWAGPVLATAELYDPGATTANIAVSNGPSNQGTGYNYNSISVGTSEDHTFSVQNSGGLASPLSVQLSGPFAFKGGNFPGTGGTCGATLAAESTCTLVVTFTPTVAGNTSGTLSLSYSDGTNPQTISLALSGTATANAVLSISSSQGSSSYNYGTSVVGSTIDATFTLTNAGLQAATSLTATVSAPFSFKDGTYPGTGGTCGASLDLGASCTLVVTFAPTEIRASSGSLSVGYFDGTASQALLVTLAGAGSSSHQALLQVANPAIGSSYPFPTGLAAWCASIQVTPNAEWLADPTGAYGMLSLGTSNNFNLNTADAIYVYYFNSPGTTKAVMRQMDHVSNSYNYIVNAASPLKFMSAQTHLVSLCYSNGSFSLWRDGVNIIPSTAGNPTPSNLSVIRVGDIGPGQLNMVQPITGLCISGPVPGASGTDPTQSVDSACGEFTPTAPVPCYGCVVPGQGATKVLALGDSLTGGAETGYPRTYPDELNALLGTGWDVTNGGVGGYTVAQVKNRYETVYQGQGWSRAVVLAGINDIGRGATAAQTFPTMKALLDELVADHLTVTVVLLLPWKGAGVPFSYCSAAQAETDTYNQALLNWCAANNMTCLDPRPSFGGGGGDPLVPLYTIDDIHPDFVGIMDLAQLVRTAFP